MTSKDGNEDASSTKPQKNSDLTIFGISCLGYVIVATISFYFVIHQFCGKNTKRILDACYFAIVLMTSSGYKDLTPNSSLAILLAILFAIVGIFIFGALMSLGADQILARQPKPFEVLDSAKKHQKMQYSSIMKIKYWKVLAVSLAVHMVGGIVLLVCIGNMHFFRSLYCVSSTITTVLSIDECFSTEGRRIIALIWILYGMITVSTIIGVLTEVWRQRTKWLSVKKDLEKKPTRAALKTKDFDEDGFIRRDAYVRYRRREIKRLRRVGMEPNIRESGRKTNGTYRNFMGHSIDGDQATSNRTSKPSSKDRLLKLGNSDDVWDTIIVFVLYLGSSMVTFYVAGHHICGKKTNSILDAFYFSFVIMTSVGYGDLSPNDTLALIFASLFSLSGLCVIGKVLSMILNAVDEQQIDNLRKLLSSEDQTVATRKESILKKFKRKLVILAVLMVVGTPFVVLIEDLDFIHALYCVSITITSAGTEKCFSTKYGRIFALVWMLFGVMYKGYVFFIFTEVYIETKQRSEVLKRKITPPEPPKDHLPPRGPPSPAILPKMPSPPKKPDLPPMFGTPDPYPPPMFGTPYPYPPPTFGTPYPYPPPTFVTPDPYPPPMFGTPDPYPPLMVIVPDPYPYYPLGIPPKRIEPPWVVQPKPYPPLEPSKPHPRPKRDYGDDGDPMIPDDLIEEGMSTQEDDEAAIVKEFERLDVSGTGRLTLREVMKS